MPAVRRFLEIFRKFAWKRLWGKPFLVKLQFFKMDYWRLSNTISWLLTNIEQKCIPLNVNIVWCKNSRVTKELSKTDSFFLLNVPKYFLFSLRANVTYFLKNMPLKGFLSKLKKFLCKDMSLQNFLKSLV